MIMAWPRFVPHGDIFATTFDAVRTLALRRLKREATRRLRSGQQDDVVRLQFPEG
jgi:hypothetical protein